MNALSQDIVLNITQKTNQNPLLLESIGFLIFTLVIL